MIKKLVAFLTIIFAIFSANAQGVSKLMEQMSIEEFIEITHNPKKNEDLFVQMLFSIPPEYHQYTMPMVGHVYGISEKVRMMPGIVEWRRKLPTRIAPQLQEFAKEHLLYLDPVFYPYLMPEMWPEEDEEGHSHEEYVPLTIQMASAEDVEYKPTTIDPNSFLGQLMTGTYKLKEEKSDRSALTQGDVASVLTVMGKLKKLEIGSQGRERRNILIMDYKDLNLLLEAHINPCNAIISRLDKIEADKWFENQVTAENMTVPEFIQKCDATIKAYRMKSSSPGALRAIRAEVKEVKSLPKDAYQRKLVTALVYMFDTTKADIEAIKGKEDELKKTFHDKLLFLGTPVLLDF
ncbi:MAG: hypothetical protein J6P93_01675 [Alphaproteobacteria bacterium]|nr:hypothetical protein [Alphaproteobacteria bacterium]